MNDVLIFLSFAAFVLSPCFIALRSRDRREEAKLGPRLVPARAPRISSGPRKQKKLIVDSLAELPMQRPAARHEAARHTGPRSSYLAPGSHSASQGIARRGNDNSVFIPPTRQIPTLGYTASPVPALVYGLPRASSEDLLLLVLPGGRAQQRPLSSF